MKKALLCIGMALILSHGESAEADTAPIINLNGKTYVPQAGHPSLQEWLLPSRPEVPADNPLSPMKVKLGEKIFFDTNLSSDKKLACASCHNPDHGWSDGLPRARGFKGKVLQRATPTIINSAFNFIQNWDGRNATLEQQALEPILNPDEMNMEHDLLMAEIRRSAEYRAAFEEVFGGDDITAPMVGAAIAAFERTVISDHSAFDRWVKGDQSALTDTQVIGFRFFLDPQKGNCATCHVAPNFTDNGFHNIGLASFHDTEPDIGRYKILPLPALKGAFKTSTLRNISETAPYFHDGSAGTLAEAVKHYNSGGIENPYISTDIRPLNLSEREVEALVAFLKALTGPVRSGYVAVADSGK